MPEPEGPGDPWLWLAQAEPAEGALGALRGVLGDLGPLPHPDLLVAKVVNRAGDPIGGAAPRLTDPDLAVAAFERHVVPLRWVLPGAMLVRREVVDRFGLPAPGDLRWSARVLRHGFGLLVPAAVAVGDGAAGGERPGALARLLVSDALEWRERGLVGFRLAEAALSAARRGA
jgi:hypothetical protein